MHGDLCIMPVSSATASHSLRLLLGQSFERWPRSLQLKHTVLLAELPITSQTAEKALRESDCVVVLPEAAALLPQDGFDQLELFHVLLSPQVLLWEP